MKKYKLKQTQNNENIIGFLQAAINDISGNLSLIDTKISIVLAATGAVLGVVASCKTNILRAYNFYSSKCFCKELFLLLAFLLGITIIITFAFGIKCISIRNGKSKTKSLWFFKTEDFEGISEQEYKRNVNGLTDNKIIDNLSSELYKLNSINCNKMQSGRITIIMFSVTCAVISSLMIMVGIFYLVV